MTEVTKRIHRIVDHTITARAKTIDQAVEAIVKQGTPVVTEENFQIFHNIPYNNIIRLSTAQIAVAGELSFKISAIEISSIVEKIARIMRSPKSIEKYLRNIDSELGRRMSEDGIEFSDADLPQYDSQITVKKRRTAQALTEIGRKETNSSPNVKSH